MSKINIILLLCATVFLVGCGKSLPEDEYVAYYEQNCKTETEQSGIRFFAMALTPDYEKIKWGAPLDSGIRVIVGAMPRSDISFEKGFLIDGLDTSEAILQRKMQTFEVGSADMFVLSFADRMDGATLRLKNVSQGIGYVVIELKNCKKIRLVEKK